MKSFQIAGCHGCRWFLTTGQFADGSERRWWEERYREGLWINEGRDVEMSRNTVRNRWETGGIVEPMLGRTEGRREEVK